MNENEVIEVLSDGVTVRIDYLTMTVHGEDDPQAFYSALLGEKLGDLEEQPYQQRMYKRVFKNDFVTLYFSPLALDKKGRNHFSIEIKGSGCSCLTPDDFRDIHASIIGGIDITFSRIDLAFDNCPFSVGQFRDAVYDGIEKENLHWHGNRESIQVIEQPFKRSDTGKTGNMTIYLGKRSSNRFVRVYDGHGFTRFETEYKAEWAQKVAMLVLGSSYSDWFDLYRGLIKSYLNLNEQNHWWVEFLQDVEKADLHVYSAKQVRLAQIVNWVRKQVAPSLFAIVAIEGVDFLMGMVSDGSKRGLPKYNKFISDLSEKNINLKFQESEAL